MSRKKRRAGLLNRQGCLGKADCRGRVCLVSRRKGSTGRAGLLRQSRSLFGGAQAGKELVYIDPACEAISRRHDRPGSCRGRQPKSKILLFRNIFNSPDKEQNRWFSAGALYLASGLKRSGFETVFSDSRISLEDNEFVTEKKNLETILRENPDLNFIGISLCEDFFAKARELTRFLKKRTKAFIGVGGVMPTLTPAEVFVHLPEINFLVRGAGEEVFPQLVRILDGANSDSNLSREQIKKLLRLKGLFFQSGPLFICASPQEINGLKDYDRSQLDFSFLNKDDLSEGLNLFTSRGCFNNCFFCTSFGRGEYAGKSLPNLKKILNDYRERLNDIFSDNVPLSAFKLSFNDDDFLADFQRAESFFAYLKQQPFLINFFQTGINSFFLRKERGYGQLINRRLLRHLSPSLFSPAKTSVYIGTENFSDNELKRLNKGYDYGKIEKVVRLLSEKKIRQSHHFIASNQLTRPEDILENLLKIAQLRILYGDYFSILAPIIPYLVSYYPSVSYRIAEKSRRNDFFNLRGKLSVSGYLEYDYPLVKNDIPLNKLTRAIIPELSRLFLTEKDYAEILDMILLTFRLLQLKMPSHGRAIGALIGKYDNYPEMIYRKTGRRLENNRNNLQLMITRRCQLRCRYCPVVKKNQDMEKETLCRAIDLLFTSSRENLRLDFTGGEPLLRFDLVEKGVRYAKELAARKGKKISFYLVTNLIALDERSADFLAKEDFFLELSFDGKERFHNYYKRSKNRRLNPYRISASRLNMVFSRKINNYAVMVVAPFTAGYLYSNFCHLLEVGFRRIGINYALGSLWREPQRKQFFRQMDLVKKRFSPFLEKGMIKLSNLDSRVEPAILNSEIMIDVDGKVYFLTDMLFEKEDRGNVDPLGKIGDFRYLNLIPLTRFRALQRLLKFYRSSSIASTVANNVEMGRLVKDYFEQWKKDFRQ